MTERAGAPEGGDTAQPARPITRLLPLLPAPRGLLAGTAAARLLSHGLAVTGAALAAWTIAQAATGADPPRALLHALIVCVAAQAVAAGAALWTAGEYASRIAADLRQRVYEAVERTAPACLQHRRSGDVGAAACSDVEATAALLAEMPAATLTTIVVPGAALAALGFLHLQLVAVLAPFLLVLTVVPFWLARRASERAEAVRADYGLLHAETVDGVQGLRELVGLGQGPAYRRSLGARNWRLFKAQLRYGSRVGTEQAVADALAAGGVLGILAAGISLAGAGQLDPAALPVAVVLAGCAFAPTSTLTRTAPQLGLVRASAGRIHALIAAPDPLAGSPLPPPAALGAAAARVRFESVRFRYRADLPDAVADATFEVAPGETVALVGPSGAGKSTCAHLLMRFWDPLEGRITIGGHDLRSLPLSRLRELVTLVPQEVYLFNASLADNLRLGRPDASDEELIAAARRARVHEFVEQLPEGYQTAVGERGLQLSGGQRQRLALARALLRAAPVLVMDEAVSSLDAENERLLQVGLREASRGRTTLLIAHRLSTIRTADRIVVLSAGRVVEAGAYEALIAADGVFAHLIAAQRLDPWTATDG